MAVDLPMSDFRFTYHFVWQMMKKPTDKQSWALYTDQVFIPVGTRCGSDQNNRYEGKLMYVKPGSQHRKKRR